MRRVPSVLRPRTRTSGADYIGGRSDGRAYGRFNPGHTAALAESVRASQEVAVTFVSNKRSDLSKDGA